jgi:predicted phage-related endonuclease
MTLRIPITSRDQWLARRKFDVTASVVGAVFGPGVHPYTSPLRLFVEKQGLVDLPAQPDNGAMRRGRILEHAIPAAVAEQRPEWQLEKCGDYYCDDEIGLGATPDFFIHGDPRGLGILQAKTAAPWVFDQEWHVEECAGNEIVKPPHWIVLQTLTEAMLTGAVFGAVVCLVVDPNELPCHIVEIARDLELERQIRERVVQFWKDIEAGTEPDVDYGADRALLAALMPRERPDTVDLSTDNEVVAGLIERRDLKARMKADEKRCDEIETLVMSRMGTAGVATIPEFSVTWKVQHRKGYTVEPSHPRVLNIRNKKEAA